MSRILVVEDEQNMQSVIQLALESAGHRVVVAEDGAKALKVLGGDHRFDCILSDFKMPRMDGITLLRQLHHEGLRLPFILITAYGTIHDAVEVMKLGAVDVLTKPFTKDALLGAVARVSSSEMADEATVPGTPASAGSTEAESLIRKVGPTGKTVLLTGESGTGKEVAARKLHQLYCGDRARPFVWFNCPAVPEPLVESELFGYRKGAFTGADRDLIGKVEQADGGTLFLDEIGDLPLAVQPKLLRLLENRTYEPLGTGQTREVSLRVICATNRNLKKMVGEGSFREDLLYRINTFTIKLPALRERSEDIPALAGEFLMGSARELGKALRGFSPGVMEVFQEYCWPGNIRELKNVVEHAAVLAAGPLVTERDLPTDLLDSLRNSGTGLGHGLYLAASASLDSSASTSGRTQSALEYQERMLIEKALVDHEGNVCAAARTLGITRNTLRYRMSKYDIVPRSTVGVVAENHHLGF